MKIVNTSSLVLQSEKKLKDFNFQGNLHINSI